MGWRLDGAPRVSQREMRQGEAQPVIQWAVEEAASERIEEIIYEIVGAKEAIEAHFGPAPALDHALEEKGKDGLLRESRALAALGAHVTCVLQPEPLGLGHAVWCAREQVGGEPFAVLLPDDMVLDETPCLQQMVAAYGKVGGNLVAVEDVPREHTNRYGIVDPGDGGDTGETGALVAVAGLGGKADPAG